MHLYDMVIVGGGPAGLAAAISAKEQGVENIIILEQEEELGGILKYFIHNNFGKNIFGKIMTGPEYIQKFVNRIIELGIDYKVNTTVINISDDKTIYAVNETDGIINIEAKAIIVATGCREMLRGLNVPRTRCTGIFTCGLAHRIVNKEGFLPGKNIVIYGVSRYALLVARRLKIEGANVKIITEKCEIPTKYKKIEYELANEFDIPIILNSSIVQILGKDRVKGVTLYEIPRFKDKSDNAKTNIECDTLLIAADLYPETKVIRNTSIEIDNSKFGILVNQNFSTNVSGIFACGNVIGNHSIVESVTLEGLNAGKNAALYFVNRQCAVNL